MPETTENISLNIEENNASTDTSVVKASAVESNTTEPRLVNVPVTFLQNVRSIIQVAGDRGAFKTQEMLGVGTVFNDLEKLINN